MSYEITAHAVSRYRTRVKPAYTFRQAASEMDKLLPLCDESAERPEWLPTLIHPDTWLTVCDSLAFPVANGRVFTCMTRGGISASARAVRSKIKRGRRHERQAAQTKFQSNHALRREEKARKPLRRLVEDDNETGAALLAAGGAPDHREVPR